MGWDGPATLDSVYFLPDEYAEAIHYNLAIRLCSAYKIEPQRSTIALAKSSRQTIRNANTQVPELIMPSGFEEWESVQLVES